MIKVVVAQTYCVVIKVIEAGHDRVIGIDRELCQTVGQWRALQQIAVVEQERRYAFSGSLRPRDVDQSSNARQADARRWAVFGSMTPDVASFISASSALSLWRSTS